ncbi:hypothetical protein, partial [Rhizobium hidalgonense]|uniref:hypothetical protein n=1 Tax=Rhizobium hidalgonense TaxID=1538159 RepID=UPI001A9E2184
ETWVNSQWKYLAAPGQLSVEINSGGGIDNIDLVAGPWLIKKNIGKSAPSVPDSICQLFG